MPSSAIANLVGWVSGFNPTNNNIKQQINNNSDIEISLVKWAKSRQEKTFHREFICSPIELLKLVQNQSKKMKIKEQLLREIESSSEELLLETLDFLKFLKNKKTDKIESKSLMKSTGKSLLENLETLDLLL